MNEQKHELIIAKLPRWFSLGSAAGFTVLAYQLRLENTSAALTAIGCSFLFMVIWGALFWIDKKVAV